MNKVLLGYNGSLDSTLCIHWLKEHNDLEVIAHVVDLGLEMELDDLAEQAILSGALSTHFEDLTDSFCRHFVIPSLFANLATVDNDPLSTALGRPAICKSLIDTAKEIGAEFIAHGSKPDSDDNILFDNYLKTLAPGIKIIKPLEEWNLKTKEQKINYANKHGMSFNFDYSYDERSIDGNIWGQQIFKKSLDDTWASSARTNQYSSDADIVTPLPEQLIIEFRHGIPISLQNSKMPVKDIIKKLNAIGKKHEVGHLDVIGHKINNLKTRKIIKCPGATILSRAHQALECLTLDRPLLDFKAINTPMYRRLVSSGYWFTQYREVLDACFKQTQTHVSGEVKIELYNGQVNVIGRRSPLALSVETGEINTNRLQLFRSSHSNEKKK